MTLLIRQCFASWKIRSHFEPLRDFGRSPRAACLIYHVLPCTRLRLQARRTRSHEHIFKPLQNGSHLERNFEELRSRGRVLTFLSIIFFKLDLKERSSSFSKSKNFPRRGLGQNVKPKRLLYGQFLGGEICYMGKVLVPGRPSDRLSWGEAESGPIMTAMQGAKKGPTVLHKCFFFFFEASENREPPKKTYSVSSKSYPQGLPGAPMYVGCGWTDPLVQRSYMLVVSF